MTVQDFYRKLHSNFKNKYILREFYNPKEVQEYECFFKLTVNSKKTDSGLDDILIFIRGINGVTIVKTEETSERQNGIYATKLYIKYTPQTFNRGIRLENVYQFLEKEIRKFGPSISLNRISAPPGQLVSSGK